MKKIYQANIFYPEKLRKIYAPPAKIYQLGENENNEIVPYTLQTDALIFEY